MNLIEKLEKRKLISPPRWLGCNTAFLTIFGSMAYGCNENESDVDVVGFCIPPKEQVFPHLAGHIPGFGRQAPHFEQYLQHHIEDKDAGKSYDLTVYSIVKYFQLLMDNNPNIIDSLFIPRECIILSTQIAEKVRENKHLFLHKGLKHKYSGYAYSQLNKINSKEPVEGKRKELVDKFGYDTKFAMHLVRLINYAEELLTTGDLDMRRNSEMLKHIRRGGWTKEELIKWFSSKEKELDNLYKNNTTLPHKPEEEKIKSLLIECLSMQYQNLQDCLIIPEKEKKALEEIKSIISKYGV